MSVGVDVLFEEDDWKIETDIDRYGGEPTLCHDCPPQLKTVGGGRVMWWTLVANSPLACSRCGEVMPETIQTLFSLLTSDTKNHRAFNGGSARFSLWGYYE